MPKGQGRVFSRELKVMAVQRIQAGEKVQALAAELGVSRALLYKWWNHYERGGPEALRFTGRPRRARAPTAEPLAAKPEGVPERIAELERKIGQQALELDFFKQALRYVKAPPPPNAGTGARASSPSSRR
jgi:transposase